MLDKVVEDPSYSAYLSHYKGELRKCYMYTHCEVISLPQIVESSFGGGWILPKNSALSPIFSYYVSIIKESGGYFKIKAKYDDFVGPEQLCTDYDGKPIGIHKSSALLSVILAGAGLSFCLFV